MGKDERGSEDRARLAARRLQERTLRHPPNKEQQEILDEVLRRVKSNEGGIILINGSRGTGKTELGKNIRDLITSLDRNVLVLGPSGSASKNFGADGSTIHRPLKMRPSSHVLTPDGLSFANEVRWTSREKEELAENDVIILDECYSALSIWVNELEERCREVGSQHKIAGGKLLVLLGDSLQQGGVLVTTVANGSYLPVSRRDLFRHSLWSFLNKHSQCVTAKPLTKLERKNEDTTAEWATYVDQVSRGEIDTIELEQFALKNKEEVAELIVESNDGLIACGTHRLCHYWNQQCLNYYCKESDRTVIERPAYVTATIVPTTRVGDGPLVSGKDGLPAEVLQLAIGCRVYFIRSVGQFCKHTIAKVIEIGENFVLVEVVAEGTLVLVSRREFQYRDGFGEVRRMMQFPLNLGYAKTHLSLQGGEVECLVLETTNAPWSHGAIGVLLGRTKAQSAIYRTGTNSIWENVFWPEMAYGDGSLAGAASNDEIVPDVLDHQDILLEDEHELDEVDTMVEWDADVMGERI